MYQQYLKIQPGLSGQGVFTTVKIPANQIVFEVIGPVMLDREVPNMNDPALLQVGPNTFIGGSGSFGDYINHSCDPNCRMYVVGNRAIVYSMYVIPAGAELTFDYSTTSTDTLDSWKMNCQCGSNKCRKVISGHQYLDAALKEQYAKKGMLPLYILEPSLIQKR